MRRLLKATLTLFFTICLLPLSAARLQAAPADYFISAQEVSQNLDSLKIIDARGYKAYLKGHLPGAIVTDWQSLSDMTGDPGTEQWGTLLPSPELAASIRKLGLQKDDNIVVYADTPQGWGEDGRVAWSLRSAGLTNVRILDGGYPLWKHKQYKTSLLPKLFTSDSEFSIQHKDDTLTTGTQPLLEQYSQVKIIDTRSQKEFEGATDYGEARGGHLPAAINLPYDQLLDSQGKLKPLKDIDAMMARLGISKESQIITYCTAGIRSAHMVIALKAAGYSNVRNYDPSFYRWAALPYTRID